jgi:hypothetical protein
MAGKTIEHAKRLGLAAVTLHKWQEPTADYTDSGCYNPLDRIETIVRTALELNKSPDDALSPIYYLAKQFNLAAVPCSSPRPQKVDVADVSQNLLATIREFGDLTREAAAALADRKIRKPEANRIDKEGWELIRQAVVFIQAVHEAVEGPRREVKE